MGLFSFLKNAGAKLRGKSEENIQAENNRKAGALVEMVQDLGLKIDYLDIRVDDDKVAISGQTESHEDREKIILMVGNTNGIATVDDNIEVVAPFVEEVEEYKPELETQFYEVKKGDTLGKIAKAFYEDAMKYPVIFEANKPMLSDPNKIYPGQMLRIPPLMA